MPMTFMTDKKIIKVARIATIPNAFNHILRQIEIMVKNDIQVHLISSNTEYLKILKKKVSCPHIAVEINRNINIKKDLKALIALYFIFKKNKYDVVHSSTPKAGFLVSIAAFIARVPLRIHTFTGQRWATETGIFRKLLMFLDIIICKLSTELYADSKSQIDFLVDSKIVKIGKIRVIGSGSFGGIDLKKFNPQENIQNRLNIFNDLKLDPDSFILIFIGRINKDKGIDELITAFSELSSEKYNIDLIILGNLENESNPLSDDVLNIMHNHKRIHCIGYSSTPQEYLAISDVFCLPSYREGFPTSVMEAAAMGLPAIGAKIPGTIDAIIDGKTGLLVEKKSKSSLKEAIIFFIKNPGQLKEMGERAKLRVEEDFGCEGIANQLIKEYRNHF